MNMDFMNRLFCVLFYKFPTNIKSLFPVYGLSFGNEIPPFMTKTEPFIVP